MSFVHLHNHSHYSTLDGLSKPKDMIKKAKELNQSAMAITDHGNLMGVIDFYQEAVKQDIKPIIGSEFYIVEDMNIRDKNERKHHLVLLAKNDAGYKNLILMSSKANLDGFYNKPRIDKELLKNHSEGLIGLSACLAGEIPSAIISGDHEKAKQAALWYKAILGKDNFYLEMQHHPELPEQEKANEGLKKLSKELGIGLVATNDSHYVNKNDDVIQDALICINTGKFLKEKEGRMCMIGGDYSILSTQEMEKHFRDVPEAIENTEKIAAMCELEIKFKQKLMPVFECPDGLSEDDYLHQLCEKGLFFRYGVSGTKGNYIQGQEFSDKKLPVPLEEIIATLEFELGVVKSMGFPGYFLIVQDFVNWAKNNGIVVGPGRGSAAGSLISYLTGITDIDPLKYGLLFERFLNPDRISMPDIDIDFQDDKRDLVLEYVRKKYGENNVAQVVTYQTLGARNSIKDIGRVMSFSIDEVNRITSLIPQKPNITISECLNEGELKKFYANNSQYRELIDMAKRIEGTIRGTGTHACAVIISGVPVTDIVPLQYPPKEKQTIITQYEGTQLDTIGLLKMDFLGIRNLTIISEAVGSIRKTKKKDFRIEDIPFDDPKTFKLYGRAQTEGIFQFESDGMKKYLRELKPNRFEDLVAMNALYRPGPMQYIPDFISRKHGRQTIVYDHPLMEKYLKDTYGITVYQEQVMLLARELAGFTRGESDSLRKAMGKKLKDIMAKLKTQFIEGCLKNPEFTSKFTPKPEYPDAESLCKKIWGDWENFAEYAFNKSHSVCYAYVSYQTAYLKANYPIEFMSAMLNSVRDNSEKVQNYIEECENMGIRIIRPDVNYSYNSFSPTPDGRVAFGLQAIKNVGAKAIETIVEEREKSGKYKNIFDFLERIDISKANRRAVEHLAMAGALDSLGHFRSRIVDSLETLMPHFQSLASQKSDWGNSLFGDNSSEQISVDHPPLPLIPEWDKTTMLENEKQLIGLYVSGHPLDEYKDVLKAFSLKKKFEQDNYRHDDRFTIGGMIKNIEVKVSKTGRDWAVVSLLTLYEDMNFSLSSNSYEKYKEKMTVGSMYFFKMKVFRAEAEFKMFVDEIFDYQHALEIFRSRTKKIRINISPAELDETLVNDFLSYIESNKGEKDLYFRIRYNDESYFLKSESYKVNGTTQFIKGIRDLFGEDSVDFS
jgi:DNA polymerase III subunit alpha